MRFALVQFAADLDVSANLVTIDAMLANIDDVDVVVLPEATMRDFGTDDLSTIAQDLDGEFVSAMTNHARRLGAVVIAGMFEKAEPLPFNTVVIVNGEGLLSTYRKIHLYDSFGYRESDRLQSGPIEACVVDVNGAKLGIMTCYDVRFPEHARMLIDAGAEVLVVPSAWVVGENKVHHWFTLLTARAIENSVPVVAAAQSGPRYSGHTLALDANGTIVEQAENEPAVIVVDIDLEHTTRVRHDNPSLANRRI